MKDMLLRYGRFITAYILISCTVWIVGLVIVPQLMMVDYSLWYRDETAVQKRLEKMNVLEDRLLMIDSDIAAEKYLDHPDQAKIDSLDAEYESLSAEISKMEASETSAVKKYGMKNYMTLFSNTLHRSVFLKSIWSSVVITLLAFAICYPVACYLAFSVKKQTAALLFLGLVIPYWVNEILRTFAWLIILSYKGVLNTLLMKAGFISQPIDFLNGNVGVLAGMAYAYVLFMVFPMYNTLSTLDKNQIEAARDLGASWIRIHRRIIIPYAKPGIAVGSIMTFMLAAGTYAVPAILGGTSGIWFTQIIYSWFFDGGNWNQGSAYAFILLLLCVVFIAFMMRLFRVKMEDMAK